jgi:hypothetical protein
MLLCLGSRLTLLSSQVSGNWVHHSGLCISFLRMLELYLENTVFLTWLPRSGPTGILD